MKMILGVGLFALAAWLGSKHALWIPAIVLAAAGLASLLA